MNEDESKKGKIVEFGGVGCIVAEYRIIPITGISFIEIPSWGKIRIHTNNRHYFDIELNDNDYELIQAIL